MSAQEFIQSLNEKLFIGYFYPFWGRVIIRLMSHLGPDNDSELQRLISIFENYYDEKGVTEEEVDNVGRAIVKIRGPGFLRDESALGMKYRIINAIAMPRPNIENYNEVSEWIYGVETALDFIVIYCNDNEEIIEQVRDDFEQFLNRSDIELP
jgi:hypothetical protein